MVLEGELVLVIDDKEKRIKKGQSHKIIPPSIHYAYGDWVCVDVYTKPGWSEDDHFLVR